MSKPTSSNPPHLCSIGIDVAKRSFQAAASSGDANTSFSYDPAGIKEFLQWLTRFQVQLVVLEATGGYQKRLVAALADANYSVVVANPRQVRDFARAKGILAKSDKIDAAVIADFAQTIRPKVRPLPNQEQQRLCELVSRRNQLIAMSTQEKNRLGQSATADLQKSIQRTLKTFEKEIAKIEVLIEKALAACPEYATKVELLDQQRGIGRTAATAMVAALPEIGLITGREITSLAGLAPFDFESGKFKGQRRIWGGRAQARRVLYMIALTLVRMEGQIRTFYQKLLGRGKKKKVAITAVMRKVLVQLNAKIRDDLTLNKNTEIA